MTTPTPTAPDGPGQTFRRRIDLTVVALVGVGVTVLVVSAVAFSDAARPDLFAPAVVTALVGAGALAMRRRDRGPSDPVAWAAGLAAAIGVHLAVYATDPTSAAAFVALFLLTGLLASATTAPLAAVAVVVLATVALLTQSGPRTTLVSWVWQPAALVGNTLIANLLAADLLRRLDRSAVIEREAASRAALMTLVAGAARGVATLDPDDLLEEVVTTALRLGFDSGNVSLFSDDQTSYRVVHPQGFDVAYGGDRTYAADIGMTAEVIAAVNTVVVDSYEDHPNALPALRGQGYRRTIATPIHVHGELVGALVAGRRDDEPLEPGTVEAIEMLASMCGRALENARRFTSEQAAVERLERLDTLKSDFVSNVSHELRTPLTVIEGIGLTLRDRGHGLPADLHDDLVRRLVDNAGRLTEIVSRLLDFTRLEAGTLRLELDDVDLRDILEVVVVAAHTIADDHRVSLEVDDHLPVHADAMLVERIVENLVNNALTHTPAGTNVVVSAHRDGAVVRVEVRDDGPGISEDDQRHLFDRFFRGGEPNTRETGGLGLGLAFADELVRLHGSELSLTSAPGEGTAFRFELRSAAVDA